ncbi:MAG TPA: DUF2891 domain-containing protein, partial [Micropepsaceae bacterium]|nr:DUF2891 domain-containing protein [Micropepsaceae bacterium]
PGKLYHVLTGPADLKGPRALHPIFFGSFDWHSCVHSYWLLATLYRLYPDLPERNAIRALLSASFTKEKIAGERAYLKRASAGGFERPYGWAWLLMLQAELLRHETPEGKRWGSALRPLAGDFVARFKTHLAKATYPNRAGTHGNTAFALVLAQEYAATVKGKRLADAIRAAARGWYAKDADCQAWEPSAEDFLSPALIEAECMRHVLPRAAFRAWSGRFLPKAAQRRPASLFAPAHVSDRSDGRIVHLDGLNLSRAWCWQSIADGLSRDDPVRDVAARTAQLHLSASLPFIAGNYMGEHWLASFALLALRPPPPFH